MSRSEGREDADEAAEALFASGATPDAIYGTVDQLAEAAQRAAQERGLAVPDDIRIATCSDTELARHATPPITTLDDRGHELGVRAVERLLRAIDEPYRDGDTTIVPTDLLVRASTVGDAVAVDR